MRSPLSLFLQYIAFCPVCQEKMDKLSYKWANSALICDAFYATIRKTGGRHHEKSKNSNRDPGSLHLFSTV
jgi:hypothetical protein